MIDHSELEDQLAELIEAAPKSVWGTPVICRVEVDLPGWLNQLTGEGEWEVFDEEEDETCISFAMREKALKNSGKSPRKNAEVTLYHNGYAVVNVDGKALFDGSLTTGTSACAHLSYYDSESGEQILLN